jgi:hypothetical protein
MDMTRFECHEAGHEVVLNYADTALIRFVDIG